ncbi:MAG: sulfite exporter TauE/SafE family protein [Taibaiella sp.]|nr:sulfite exporter TauE/SafE family protein [Taibaiella sp.]
MSYSTFFVAVLMGLAGSLHCAGMCGAIVWIMPFQSFSGITKLAAIALYHIARITVYALMALLLFTFRDMFNPHIQQFVSVFLGCLLLVAGILSFLPGQKIVKVKLPWAGYVQQKLGAVIGQPVLWKITMAGALNGLLPCGLVYMALSSTLSLGSPAAAVGFIYAFGLGTLPLLVSITLLKNQLHLRLANARRFAPILIFSFGCLFVLRGLNLGIPYLSPKVEIADHQIRSCCHKK